jgi:hypothetical protein
MAKRNYSNSEIKVQKWLKEGRGSGQGRDYKPWLTVRDVPSDGRSHRIFGHKSQRIHHFLSDLELAVFFVLEWHQDTEDIREQFPLRTEDTLALANDLGISHPSYRGVPQIMTSDFLVNTKNAQRSKFVLQAKYSEALQDARTIEKLELERRYWLQKSIPWMLITEKDIPNIVFQNISWLYPAQREELETEIIQEHVVMYTHHFSCAPSKSLIDIAKQLDAAYALPAGQTLLEIRQLLARRCFLFDIFTPYTALKARDLCAENMITYTEALRVSNQ